MMATSLGLVLLASLAFGQPGARTQNEDESDGFGGVLVATPGALPSGLPQVQLVLVAEGLADPVDIAAANDGSDRLFIVERYGQIRVVDASGALLETPFLDLSAQVQSGYMEQGLLGLAFHPDYRGNGRFFVAYTDRRTNGDTFVMEFQVSPDDANIADPKSGRLLLAVDQPFVEHNGGTLRFGPDGYLYIGMGDGGFSGDPYDHAQDRGSLLGKLLRIDVDTPVPAPYAIPTDNPLAGPGRNDNPFLPIATPADARGERREGRKPRGQNPQAVLSESGVIERPRPEIWALGFRNPWQFSFDPDSGDLYIPDVGQKTWEEINVEPAGSIGGLNYGWDWLEGSHCYPEEIARCPRQQIGTLPVAEYAHGEDNCAIVGIGVYRGDASPSLDGIYFNTDFCSGTIWG
ncbi:MAG: PQQ-dependent sugar dehydrogenase, partial [Thermomicrobiales bacterium]